MLLPRFDYRDADVFGVRAARLGTCFWSNIFAKLPTPLGCDDYGIDQVVSLAALTQEHRH